VQSFGEYFGEDGGSDALGAAYEGIFLLPRDVGGFHPRVWRLFDFLENSARHCPAGCHKYLPVAALMVHLNDDHHWTREQIADWVRSASPQEQKGKGRGSQARTASERSGRMSAGAGSWRQLGKFISPHSLFSRPPYVLLTAFPLPPEGYGDRRSPGRRQVGGRGK